MAHKQKKEIRSGVSLALSFLLALCMTSFMLILGCRIGIFNANVLMNQLDKTSYYDNVSAAIYENAVNLLRPSGLPETVMDNVIENDRVHQDVRAVIKAELSGREHVVDLSYVEQTFLENINSYMETENISPGDETDEGIQNLLGEIKKEYIRCLKFPFVKYFVRYQTAFEKIYLPSMCLLAILAGTLCAMLIKLQRWAHRGIRYIFYATAATGLMIGVIPTAIWLDGSYERLNISPQYLYEVIVGIIRADTGIFAYIAAGCFVLAAMELILIGIMKKRAMR